jgi:CheY-like chemotaxis protein
VGRILVVEDNVPNLDLMTLMLTASGHTVIPAATGADGLEQARTQSPDLVVLDLQLPDADGRQVLARIRADPALAMLPVVAVTAYAMVGDREKALADGFDGYVSKPIVPATFSRMLDQFLPPALRGHAPRRWSERSPEAT